MKIGVAKNKKKVFVSLYKKNLEIHPIWSADKEKEKMVVTGG